MRAAWAAVLLASGCIDLGALDDHLRDDGDAQDLARGVDLTGDDLAFVPSCSTHAVLTAFSESVAANEHVAIAHLSNDSFALVMAGSSSPASGYSRSFEPVTGFGAEGSFSLAGGVTLPRLAQSTYLPLASWSFLETSNPDSVYWDISTLGDGTSVAANVFPSSVAATSADVAQAQINGSITTVAAAVVGRELSIVYEDLSSVQPLSHAVDDARFAVQQDHGSAYLVVVQDDPGGSLSAVEIDLTAKLGPGPMLPEIPIAPVALDRIGTDVSASTLLVAGVQAGSADQLAVYWAQIPVTTSSAARTIATDGITGDVSVAASASGSSSCSKARRACTACSRRASACCRRRCCSCRTATDRRWRPTPTAPRSS